MAEPCLHDAALLAELRVALAGLDCGDNSCGFVPRPRTGMRTNGGCRCLRGHGGRAEQAVRWVLRRIAAAEVPHA